MIRVDDISVWYPGTPAPVITDLSLTIGEAERVGLVGASGSGKSTLGRTIVGLVKPVAGTISLDGQRIDHLSYRKMRALRGRIQMVFQDPFNSLNPAFTIRRSLRDAARGLQLAPEKFDERLSALAAQVSLDESMFTRTPAELSGGQLQRVSIVRALITEPRFIFLDEPTSALDASVEASFVSLLRELAQENSLTYLFATHDLRVVSKVCERIVVMNQGEIVEAGASDAIMQDPQHEYTKQLIAAASHTGIAQ